MISNSLRQKLDFLIERYHDLVPNYASGVRELSLVELPEMVYNSNAIENSTLTLEDTEDILIRHQIRTDHQIREIFEATNLAKAMKFLIDNPETEISAPLILQLHSILLQNIRDDAAGWFRANKEWVRVGSHLGANPQFVHGFMSDLVKKYNASDGQYFLDKIVYFHAEFENIHPFIDGNGRIGRLLINEQLDLLNLPPILIPNKSKNEEYYPALEEYSNFNKLDRLSDFFARLLIEALYRRITRLTAPRIISVSDWAKQNQMSSQSATNKAIRGTIPAFRLRGHWMIDADFQAQKYEE